MLALLFLLLAALPMSQSQGFMPVHGGVDVIGTATLHAATTNSFDASTQAWTVSIVPDQPGANFALFLLDQRGATGPSYNFLTDVAPWCAPVEGWCCIEEFLLTTAYMNSALQLSTAGIPSCARNSSEYGAVVRHLRNFGDIAASEGVRYNYSSFTLTLSHTVAQKYGAESLDEYGNYLIDLRLVGVFATESGGFQDMVWVPYQSVLLRDINTLITRSFEDVRECVALNASKPENSFWLARYEGNSKVCQWFFNLGLYAYPPHAQSSGMPSTCEVPRETGMTVGFTVWLLMNSTELSRTLQADVAPTNLTMQSSPLVGGWLDGVSATMSAAFERAVLKSRLLNVNSRVLSELHSTQYAREWRIYMHSARKIYENLVPANYIPVQTVLVRDSQSSPYVFPDWLQRMGVFDEERTADVSAFPMRRSLPVQAVSVEMVCIIDSQALQMPDILTALSDASAEVVGGGNISGLWGMNLFVRDLGALWSERVQQPVRYRMNPEEVCRRMTKESTKKLLRLQESGPASSLRRLESEAVVHVINSARSQGIVTGTCRQIHPADLHTLVRCRLTCTENSITTNLGTAVIKVPIPIPQCDDMESFKAHAGNILHANNTIFEQCHPLREAMLKHIKGLHVDSAPEEEAEALDEAVPSTLYQNLVFKCQKKISERGSGWDGTSRFGNCRVSARNVVRGNVSSELNWSTQARAVNAVMSSMQKQGLSIVRHEMRFRKGNLLYCLDTLYMPTTPGNGEVLSARVVKMEGNETPFQWQRDFDAVNRQFIDDDHGMKRYDVAMQQSASILRHAKQVSIRHFENQVCRKLLEKRAVQTEESRRLTAKHHGVYIQNEVMMQKLRDELQAEMTPEEKDEASAFVESCLGRRGISLVCRNGGIVRSHCKNAVDISTVQAEVEMHYMVDAPCITKAFEGKSIDVNLKNIWKIEAHGLCLLPQPALDKGLCLATIPSAHDIGNQWVKVPESAILCMVKHRAVLVHRDHDGGSRNHAIDEGVYVEDDAIVVVLILKCPDEVLRETLRAANHLSQHEALRHSGTNADMPPAKNKNGLNDDDEIEKEIDNDMEEDEGAENEEDNGDEHKEKKAGKKAGKQAKSKATSVKGAGVSKKAKEPKPAKPRRPFARLETEVLENRKAVLEERISVAKAQITIMSSKLQKYEDEKRFREEAA
ncbi:hypothetical protein GUITHDRAFT_147760 [Guillardia theta CCMP2712]|uniref:START domain-containing protein n=1 Tax=Guillardia theta (strain CCMP2712) TaxID=905079 RepID=L1IBJ4_GUITC|nr:hypothetical protein GUITHDRAFT_147760 [Guillardia theta CCMP2712]EKX33631.1 hypothetical protein GUITHDRAFT_147760 [Guillardia theta CCMP2712]|eukprot:XP_005820611.1 hypothetical protein GUITHDRAFT_147760 [Guillardia theta CCMP2712]